MPAISFDQTKQQTTNNINKEERERARAFFFFFCIKVINQFVKKQRLHLKKLLSTSIKGEEEKTHQIKNMFGN